MFQLIKVRRTPDLLTLFTTFYDLSVLCNILTKDEMRQFSKAGSVGLGLCLRKLPFYSAEAVSSYSRININASTLPLKPKKDDFEGLYTHA